MKAKLILCAVLFSAGTLLLNAQAPRQHNGAGQGQRQGQGQGQEQGPGQNREMITPEARADRMAKHLELTDAQKAKVLELFKQDEVKLKAMREEAKAMREKNEKIGDAQREKFAAQQKANDVELEKIIGKEKFAKWQAERTQQMKKMKDNRGKNQNKQHGQSFNNQRGQNQNNQHGQSFNNQRSQNQNNQHAQVKHHAQMKHHAQIVKKHLKHKQALRAQMAAKMKQHYSPAGRAERLKAELSLTDAEKDALAQLFESEQKKIAEERTQKMEAARKSHEAEMEKIIGKEKMAKYIELQKSKMDKAQKNRKTKQV